ncbi:MAG: glutamate racemase [bacterium]|nr:glutamate racemase [bacterium]
MGGPSEHSPLGIFDSGVGGLTVLQALRHRLPHESFLYLGDTARLPYGTKSAGTVTRYALNASRHLVDKGVKLLVVACNTASAFALDEVAAAVDVPVIGVVEPGVEAALVTSANRLGVIGTEGTVRSGAYQRAIADRAPSIDVRATACPLFVPLAEEGWGDHEVTDTVARHYLEDILAWGAQALILGCTHYPLLTPSLSRVVGPDVRLVDSASAVAEAVISRHRDLLKADDGGKVTIQLTDASERFRRITKAILGEEFEELEVVDL